MLEEILGSVHQLVSQILSLALVCHQQLLSAHQGNASVWNIGSSAGVGGWGGCWGHYKIVHAVVVDKDRGCSSFSC